MDVSQNDNFNLNEAVLSVDLDPVTNPVLAFSHAEWGDETHSLPDSFSGSANGDGVAISVDGTNWHTVLTGTDADAGVWTDELVDLQQVADSAGFTLGSSLLIKFQQYDNYSTNDDGRAYDAIRIIPRQSGGDWYSFDVDAGQQVSLAANPVLGIGGVNVDLFDSSGNLLQSGVASSNFQSVITGFSDDTGGTFYARVDGDLGVQYSLVVTRGAAIDVEPNDTNNPISIDQYEGVLGFVSGVSSQSADPDVAENGDNISGLFTGVTLSNPIDGGDIYAPFATFAPTGDRVFGATSNGSDGFREFDRELQANFHFPQSLVSIDVGSDDASDVGFLRAYDAQGNLLEEQISSALSTGQSETLTISRSTADIAYVIAAGIGTDITPMDNLAYSGNSDTDHYSIELGEGDIISIDASLPGAGPFLFDNGLDQASSQLQIELVDPNGTVVATGSSSIQHTSDASGTWKVNVSATSDEGEYLLSHHVNARVEVTDFILGDGSNNRSFVDQFTLNFNGVVDLQQDALSLVHRETGQAVDLDWVIDNTSGQSVVTAVFSGALTESGGSLIDGNYELTVDGSLLGSSAYGDNFVYGDSETDAFYRFFGDVDRNRTVDIFDLLPFRLTYRLAEGDQDFDGRFDSNGDGEIDVFDLLRFRQNFRSSLPWA
jgi:methionine-rich copper-binding protein CopC